jgi:hypothetical protein
MRTWKRADLRTVGAAVVLAAALAQLAAAQQRPINWNEDVEKGIAQAKKANKPIMFYVLGSSSNRDDRLEREQKRAFSNARVTRLANQFVTVKLANYQQRVDLLKKWGLPEHANQIIVFASPDGKMIDQIGGWGVDKSLAEKMELVLDKYRQELYEQDIRPKLEDAKTSPSELKAAIARVKELEIKQADKPLAEILKRERLDEGAARLIYDALAELSTDTSVAALIERATSADQKAASAAKTALAKCNPAGAEFMLKTLAGDNKEARAVAYEAIAKICKLKNVKPPKFWENADERLQKEEIDSVTELVKKDAAAWKKRNETR